MTLAPLQAGRRQLPPAVEDAAASGPATGSAASGPAASAATPEVEAVAVERRVLVAVLVLRRCTAVSAASHGGCGVDEAVAVLDRYPQLIRRAVDAAPVGGGSAPVRWQVVDRAGLRQVLRERGPAHEGVEGYVPAQPLATPEDRLYLAEKTLIECVAENPGPVRRVRVASAALLIRQYAAASGTIPAVRAPLNVEALPPRPRIAARMTQLIQSEGTGRRMPLDLVLAVPADVMACVGPATGEHLADLVKGLGQLMARQLRRVMVPSCTGRLLMTTVGSRVLTLAPATATGVSDSIRGLLLEWRERHPGDSILIDEMLGLTVTIDLRRLLTGEQTLVLPADGPGSDTGRSRGDPSDSRARSPGRSGTA